MPRTCRALRCCIFLTDKAMEGNDPPSFSRGRNGRCDNASIDPSCVECLGRNPTWLHGGGGRDNIYSLPLSVS